MVYPHLPDALRRRIHSIAVPEFGGIDHLPSDLAEYLASDLSGVTSPKAWLAGAPFGVSRVDTLPAMDVLR